MRLTLEAIRRPVWVVMAMIAAIVLGFRGCAEMPVEQNPEATFPYVTVQTVYFGANPTEIETLITRKIEDAVTTVSGVNNINSTSMEGLSLVTIELDLQVNQDAALADVKSKVDAILDELPRDAEKPVVSKVNFAAEPILYLAARSDKLNGMELRDICDNRVRDVISRVPGVADVQVTGGQVREIRVAVDPERLISVGMGINDLLNVVQGATFNIAAGQIREGNRQTSVRVQGEFTSVNQIRNLVIPITDRMDPNRPPVIVRLQDVATITDGPAERSVVSRVDGRDAVLIKVQKTREGNTVNITEAVKRELDAISGQFPITFTITRESAKQVIESMEDLKSALVIGIVLVVGIIYMFLHNFRGTLIVALAIPTCIFAAFAAMAAFGFTLNTMTMLGLSLAVGILVDDAIVVLENTYRHLTMGEDPATAALNGRMEIGLAAISITAVDLVIFLPVAFMGGIIGQFFRPFALTVAAATLFSLFVSFTLTPMLASRWYRKGENLEDKRGFAKWFDDWFHRVAAAYGRLLDKALRRRWLVFMAGWAFLFGVFMMIGGSNAKTIGDAIRPGVSLFVFSSIIGFVVFLVSAACKRANVKIVLGGLAFGGVMVLASALGFGLSTFKGGPLLTQRFAPGVESGQVTVNITMPPGSSLERTLAAVERVEQIAKTIPEASYVMSTVGEQLGFFGVNTGPQYAQVLITLRDKKALMDSLMFWKTSDLRTRSQDSIVTEVQQKIGKIPDAQVFVSGQTGFAAGPPIQVAIMSIDPEKVPPAAEKAKNIIESVPGIVNVELTSKPGNPELVIRPDRVDLADNDLSVLQLGAVARVAYAGNTDAKYREGSNEYDIRVNLTDRVKNNPLSLPNLPISFRDNNPVFLQDVANIETSSAHDKVERINRQRQITVSGYLLPGFVVGTVAAEVSRRLETADLGENVTIQQQGEFQIQTREMPYMFQAFALGLVLVFLVLASLFNNILYPLIIQLAQPQAMVGALLALIIVNRPMDLVGNIGIIMLIGLVGKNAILLVDYTNTLRSRGLDRHDALVQAGPTRLRPILMTTLAMILAMVPVALALGRGSEFRAPLGIVIIGGLTLSTLLTLFVIPASYTLFDDLSASIGNFIRRISPLAKAEAEVVEAGHCETRGDETQPTSNR